MVTVEVEAEREEAVELLEEPVEAVEEEVRVEGEVVLKVSQLIYCTREQTLELIQLTYLGGAKTIIVNPSFLICSK